MLLLVAATGEYKILQDVRLVGKEVSAVKVLARFFSCVARGCRYVK